MMKLLNRLNYPTRDKFPNKVLQFGEGNFLRAFIDWQIDLLNEKADFNGGITVIRPIDSQFPPSLNTQDGLYTTILRGYNEAGELIDEPRVITSINQEINLYQDYASYIETAKDPNYQFIFSNTTEAGIAFDENDKFTDAPATTFPAKLTQWLYTRYEYFNGDADKGLLIIPCELIDYNGDKLREIIIKYVKLWELSDEFEQWVINHNTFCSTLVDRIVTGYPKSEVETLQQKYGYQDQFMTTAEVFYQFFIQGPPQLAQQLCLDKLSLNIYVVSDITPYKARKVAILNGAHTAMVPLAYLSGIDTVGDAIANPLIKQYVDILLQQEVIPYLDLPKDELNEFALAVISRFENPFIRHELLSIALNSMTKMQTRLLPQLILALKQGKVPSAMALTFAASILFYRGKRQEQTYTLQDSQFWLTFYSQWWREYDNGELSLTHLVEKVLSQQAHWGYPLAEETAFVTLVMHYLESMVEKGVTSTLKQVLASLEDNK